MKLLKRKINKEGFIMKTEELTLRFEGENDIELETLSKSLNSTAIIAKELSNNLISENEYCKIIVKNIEPGSFMMVIQTIFETAPTLLPHVPTVINGIKSLFELKKMLNGEKPSEVIVSGTQVNVKNNKGNIFVLNKEVYDTYTNSERIDKSISAIADTILKDGTRQGLEISFRESDKDETSIHLDKKELDDVSKELDVTSFAQGMEESISTSMVKVIKPDLVGNTKWSIYRDIQKITCDIIDEEFLSKVRDGKILFKGKMLMKVKILSRYKVLDDGLPDTSMKPVYKICKVLEVEIDNNMIKVEDI